MNEEFEAVSHTKYLLSLLLLLHSPPKILKRKKKLTNCHYHNSKNEITDLCCAKQLTYWIKKINRRGVL